MIVRAKTLLCGPFGTHQPGDIADLPEELAISLIAAGYAESMQPPASPPTETEVKTAPEVAVNRTGRGRTRGH